MAFPKYMIVDGPSREVLFDSLRLIEECRRIEIKWLQPDGTQMTTQILIGSIGHVSTDNEGSDSSTQAGPTWSIGGYAPKVQGDSMVLLNYTSKRRRGWIQFGTQSESEAAPVFLD